MTWNKTYFQEIMDKDPEEKETARRISIKKAMIMEC